MKFRDKKRAVVTGGTRGMGLAIAACLYRDDYEVLITGRSSQSSLPYAYYAANFSSLSEIHQFANFLKDYAPDILINNAGINIISSFEQISLDDFLQIQQVNLIAPFCLCQAVLPYMKKKQWGRIINIASIWSKISKIGRAPYSASKFGLDGMTAALAAEVAEYNILVNCVSPGFIETDLTRQTLGDEGIKNILKDLPIKRLGNSDEIAEFVSWLVSEKNTYISGQNLIIDGGFVRV